MQLMDLYNKLPDPIQEGMEFFITNQNKVCNKVLKHNNLLIGPPQPGIVKSAEYDTVNSITINSNSPYKDYFIDLKDGTTILLYHKQKENAGRENARNKALKKNIPLQYLVGIWVQHPDKSLYTVRIGLPIAYHDPYFILIIPNGNGDFNDAILKMTDSQLRILIDIYLNSCLKK